MIGRFFVRYCNRLSIKLPLEAARALDAVKMEETVDKDKIKLLYKAGQQIEGVSEIEFVQIIANNAEMHPSKTAPGPA